MARIIVATIIRVNRICQQDATISRLLNKELLLQNVSHAKSLIKLACSPITGYFGPYQLPTLCTTISTRYYVYLVCLAYDNRLDHFFLSNSLPLEKKRNNIIVRIPSKISWASMQISIIETEFKDPSNDTQIARMKFEQAAINFLLRRWRANYPYDSNTYVHVPNKFSATYDLFTATRAIHLPFWREVISCAEMERLLYIVTKSPVSRARTIH